MLTCHSSCDAGVSPVGISDNAVHEVEVHQPEARDRGTQVQVNHILPAHPPQSLAVTHPGQSIHNLLIPGQLDAKPASGYDPVNGHVIDIITAIIVTCVSGEI